MDENFFKQKIQFLLSNNVDVNRCNDFLKEKIKNLKVKIEQYQTMEKVYLNKISKLNRSLSFYKKGNKEMEKNYQILFKQLKEQRNQLEIENIELVEIIERLKEKLREKELNENNLNEVVVIKNKNDSNAVNEMSEVNKLNKVNEQHQDVANQNDNDEQKDKESEEITDDSQNLSHVHCESQDNDITMKS